MAATWTCLWLLLQLPTAKFARALVQKSPSFADNHRTIPIGDGLLKITEGSAETIDSGARVWESGLALSRWIQDRSALVERKRCLELGAGAGTVGLTAAMLGAEGVLVTDKPEMMPLLEHNIRQNGLEGNARAAPLPWGTSDDEPVAVPPLDVVCGSDILYSPENFPLLIETLMQVCTPSKTEVLLAYPRRFTEDIFVELALEEEFELLPEEEIEANIFLLRMRVRKR